MTVTLDPQLSSLIQQKVDAGLYPDAAAALREAVRLLDEHDRLQQLRAELQIGLDQADRGEGKPFTDELFEEIKQRARENSLRGKPIKDAVKP